jgi:hypothetical protein
MPRVLAPKLGLDRALRLSLVVLELAQPPLERSLDGIHLARALAHGELEPVLLVAQAGHLVVIGHAPMIGSGPGHLHPDKAASRPAVRRKPRERDVCHTERVSGALTLTDRCATVALPVMWHF